MGLDRLLQVVLGSHAPREGGGEYLHKAAPSAPTSAPRRSPAENPQTHYLPPCQRGPTGALQLWVRGRRRVGRLAEAETHGGGGVRLLLASATPQLEGKRRLGVRVGEVSLPENACKPSRAPSTPRECPGQATRPTRALSAPGPWESLRRSGLSFPPLCHTFTPCLQTTQTERHRSLFQQQE